MRCTSSGRLRLHATANIRLKSQISPEYRGASRSPCKRAARFCAALCLEGHARGWSGRRQTFTVTVMSRNPAARGSGSRRPPPAARAAAGTLRHRKYMPT